MDTKYWGPSAWKLLHMASFQYDPTTQHAQMLKFVEHLPYVLPCKFCRKSLTEYYDADPPSAALGSATTFSKWLWRIHNCVNAKLRSQGQTIPKDPSYKAVADTYKDYLAQGCSQTSFPGWEFLFSILDTHPLSKEGRATKPFVCSHVPHTLVEKNQYNALTPEERVPFFVGFFQALPHVLPYKEWSEVWLRLSDGCPVAVGKGRRSAITWLWRIRRELERTFALKNCETYLGLCTTVAAHRSKCSTSSRAKTCRRPRQRQGRQ